MPSKDNIHALDANQSPDAYLLRHPIESGSQPIAVTPSRATIGRSPKNTIHIDAKTVSRRHAAIISRDGNYYVNDMDSHNGTYINGEKINIRSIRHRDRIAFGDQSFLFLKTSDEAGSSATDCLVDANSTIILNRDEIDPSEFLAYDTENASSELFPDKEKASEEQSIKPFKQAHRRLSLLYRLSERLRSTQNLKEILMHGLDLILEAIPTAERALIMLRSGRGGSLEVAASLNRASARGDDGIKISRTLLDWVVTEKMALMTPNIADDIRFKASESIKFHLKTVICVPIIAAKKVIGILYVDSEDPLENINQEDTAFTAAVAGELALTIDNIHLQKAVIHSERMAAIGLTVSNLAHNIKNLNMLSQNAVELMQLHLDRIGDEKADKCWKIIGQSIERINGLSLEMLDYAGDKGLTAVPTDINQAIRTSVAILTQSLENKGVELSFNLDPSISTWTIDEKQFQRAMVNLVVNAIDAIGKKADGRIEISTSVENDRRLVVAVRDNGCGIDADKQKKIFELFFTTKGTKGNGLGLPLVSKYMELSAGKLQVASEQNKGTTFKMIFPLKH